MKCGNTDVIEGVGNYAVQVDTYNANGGSDCVTATTGSGCVGFTATPNLNLPSNASAPGGYPSIVYGWHYGQFHGSYTSAKQISAIGSLPSSWAFTVPSSNVKFDVSYDIWANSAGGNPSQPDGNSLEMMIWLDETSDVVPAGTPLNGGTTVTIAGQAWQIYTGMVNTWHYIAYKRSPSTTPFSNVDLKAFLSDAATRSVGITNSWYLLSVEAGFEIWKGSSSTVFTTTGFSVSAN
jgi:xyloglucan-specific endo-beta-1,4-glucanase